MEFFSDLLETASTRPRVFVRAVILIVAVIGLIIKIVFPKIKERTNKIKADASKHKDYSQGNAFIKAGFDLLAQQRTGDAVESFEQGLRLGTDYERASDIYLTVMNYYAGTDDYSGALRWGRDAESKGVADKRILTLNAEFYEIIGEIQKADEYKRKAEKMLDKQ